MRMTPQQPVELFDPSWAAERLREVGVCLTDRHWTPLGAADDFFARYAAPTLKSQGVAAGVTTAVAEVETGRRQRKAVGLIAFGGSIPQVTSYQSAAEIATWTHVLPAYTPAALERLAGNLSSFLDARSRLAEASHQVDTLSAELSDTYEELSLVYQLGSSMTVNSPAATFLKSACETTAGIMEVRGLGVLFWGNGVERRPPLIFGGVGLGEAESLRLDALLHETLSASNEEGALLLNDTKASPPFKWLSPHVTQVLAVPMRRHGQTLGCLVALDKDVPSDVFGTFNRGVFTSMDRKLLGGVAVHVALFLENRKLFQDTESLLMGLLHSLVAAVDAKDAYTCGHSVRVGKYARRLAQEAGLELAAAERVYLSGLLHDVGKIGVDDAVLRKPGKLTDEEFAQVKRHPEIGYGILKGIPQILDILPGVLCHHEKFDGRGYPQMLAGEQIPLLGRIMCLADSFDAMTSSRTYRKALSIDDAKSEIRKCSGSHFDSGLAELFCRIPSSELAEYATAERDQRSAGYGLLQKAA